MQRLRDFKKRKTLEKIDLSPIRKLSHSHPEFDAEEREYHTSRLLSRSDDSTDSGDNKLNQSVILNEIENVRKLVLEISDIDGVDCDGKTPLHHASELGYWEICMILLEHKANIKKADYSGNMPINSLTKSMFVATFLSVKVLTILLGPKGCLIDNPTFKLDRRREIPLHTASGRGHEWLVHFLLTNGANINAQTEYVFFSFNFIFFKNILIKLFHYKLNKFIFRY